MIKYLRLETKTETITVKRKYCLGEYHRQTELIINFNNVAGYKINIK